MLDLTAIPRDFSRLNDILVPNPVTLTDDEVTALSETVALFDKLFLSEQWDESERVLTEAARFEGTFDHGFRRMHAIYTANQPALDNALARLNAVYGSQLVYHFYQGYCARHGIPNRASVSQ